MDPSSSAAQPSLVVRAFLTLGLMKPNLPLPINGLPCVVLHFPAKRLFDLTFSAAVVLFFSPIFLLVGLGIALTSKGQVIYSHERIGRGGRPFHCLKFRSMYLDADKRLEELLAKDPQAKKEWDATQKLKRDPRITPFGRFIRKCSLDEIPQFWNVLKGDLSVVGPRPVVQKEIDRHFGENAATVLSVRPGLTGVWQTSGRNNVTYQQRVAMDVRYVKERTFLQDLLLIAKTIPAMLFPNGAY